MGDAKERVQKNLFWSSVAAAAAVVVIISFHFINPLLIFNFISTVCFWAAVGAAAAALALVHSLCFGHRKAGAHISHISATCRYHHHHHHHQSVPFVRRRTHSENKRNCTLLGFYTFHSTTISIIFILYIHFGCTVESSVPICCVQII